MEPTAETSRNKIIIRTSVIGIIANVFLAGFKAAVGLLSQSIAVVLDAVNNLSDALSSLITIVGTHLSQKAPDKKHPLGYGRIEYLSAVVISVIVLYAGITSFTESVKNIIEPQTPDYSVTALVIIGAAVVVKIVLGTYVKRTGKNVDSDALVASGSDALFDSIISASTLVAAVIYLTTGLSLEAWLGAIISLVIIKSGIEMLRDTISEILGERVDPELAKGVKATVTSFPEVNGAYDLVIHNYGPEQLLGSVHIELPDTMTAERIFELENAITKKVYAEHGVFMTGISIYPVNTKNDEACRMQTQVLETVMSYADVLQMHGFYVDFEAKTMKFDIIISFDAKDRVALYTEILGKVQEQFPEYTPEISLDIDISD